MPKIYRAVAPSVEKKGWLQGKPNAKARSDFCIVFHAAELLLCVGIPILVITPPTLWESHV